MYSRTFARLGIVFSLFVLASGCDLFGDECSDCQAAIDHMYEKLPGFNCDKNRMMEAQQRIRDNCNKENQNAQYIIDCIMENCYSLSQAQPLCPAPGVGIPLLVEFDYSTSGMGELNAGIEIKLIRGGKEERQTRLPITEGQSVLFEGWSWDDGDDLSIQLFEDDIVSDPLTPPQTFDLRVRSDPRYIRYLRIRFDSSVNDYELLSGHF